MFKENFMRLLQKHGISALKLAKELGIPKSVVYEWRSGQRLPSAENLAKLSRYFGVTREELLGEPLPENIVVTNGEERELILLLRAAREVSGEERDAIMEKFRLGMEKYLSASAPANGRRNGKNGGADSQ